MLKLDDHSFSKAMKLPVKSDDAIGHSETVIIELVTDITPNKEEALSYQAKSLTKDMPLPVKMSLTAGELSQNKEEVCILNFNEPITLIRNRLCYL